MYTKYVIAIHALHVHLLEHKLHTQKLHTVVKYSTSFQYHETSHLWPLSNYYFTCMYIHIHASHSQLSSLSPTSVPSGRPEGVAIVSTSSHSFTMKWGPPPKEQQNGEIVSYKVEHRQKDSSIVVNDTAQSTVYTAEDLTTDRVYQFRVAATTVNGVGPFSEWSEVGTIPTGNGGLHVIGMMRPFICECVCVCLCVCVVRICVHA